MRAHQSLVAAMRRVLTDSAISEVDASGEFILLASKQILFPGAVYGFAVHLNNNELKSLFEEAQARNLSRIAKLENIHPIEGTLYLKATEDEKRSAERDKYSAKHLYQFFTGHQLEILKGSDIRAYIVARKSEGAAQGTINSELGLFSSAINYARNEWDWDIPNPDMGKRLREPEGRIRWLTKEQAAQLIKAAETDSRATHLPDLIRLAVNTGMRKGEMLGLEWARVDLKTNLVRLDSEHTKAAKRRGVPLNDEARSAILSRANFRAQYCPDSPWVFSNKKGERIGSVKTSFSSACEIAKIENFTFHDLRHTCAAWLVSAGASLIEVRDLLGHSTIKMTECYSHLAPDDVRVAVSRLDERSRFGHVAA